MTFVTSYIPFFGAFFAGAFAVLVALGAKGLSVALAMLAITLLANNTLQNLLEPVAFGRTLRLHPLTVLLVTTAGTLLFGVLGATLAAPVTAVTLRTIGLLREVGLFEMAAAPSAGAAERPRSQDTHKASTGPTLADQFGEGGPPASQHEPPALHAQTVADISPRPGGHEAR